MDRAEAIKRLEWLRMVGNHVDSVTLGSEDMGYFDMAIAALREQEQREQGCRGCRGAVHTDELFEVTNPHGVEVDVQFNFCPMCGRKLPEPPKEGAEG